MVGKIKKFLANRFSPKKKRINTSYYNFFFAQNCKKKILKLNNTSWIYKNVQLMLMVYLQIEIKVMKKAKLQLKNF